MVIAYYKSDNHYKYMNVFKLKLSYLQQYIYSSICIINITYSLFNIIILRLFNCFQIVDLPGAYMPFSTSKPKIEAWQPK